LCEKAALLYSINYNNINDMADQEEVQTEQVEQQNGEEFSEAAAEPMEGQETGGTGKKKNGCPMAMLPRFAQLHHIRTISMPLLQISCKLITKHCGK
jgi:hypothetical protein